MRYTFLFIMTLVSAKLFAQTSTNSTGSGNFNNSETWTSPKDLTGTANILNGHTITIPSASNVYSNKITFSGNAKLVLTNNTSKWISAKKLITSPTIESINSQPNWYASTVWVSDPYGAAHYKPWIDSDQAWSASTANSGTDYLQYDLLSPNWIQGIVTQGRANMGQCVSTAKVEVSIDNVNWVQVKNAQDAFIFNLNNDQNTKVYNNFSNVMFARYVRVTPITVISHASMRLGVLFREKSYFKSCKEILASNSSATSGVYSIDPDGAGTLPVTSCYCDMSTDGGGWTLVLNYLHLAGQNSSLTYKTQSLPLLGSTTLGGNESSSVSTWGHVTPAYLNSFTFTELRFYGKTSGHSRVIHFKTSHSGTINYFKTGTAAYSMSGIQTLGNFTPLSGHSANIPDRASTFYNNYGNDAMIFFPFFISGANHWGVGANSRWEVDDFPGSYQNSTLHQIWIR